MVTKIKEEWKSVWQKWCYQHNINAYFWCGSQMREELIGKSWVLPTNADVLLIAEDITYNQLPYLLQVYQNMPQRKWVFLVQSSASKREHASFYSVVKDISEFLPIDGTIAGDYPSIEGVQKAIDDLKASF